MKLSTFINGAKQDEPDVRDFKAINYFSKPVLAFPPVVDVSSSLGDVRDQGNLGSCCGFAAAGIKEAQEKKDTGDRFIFSPLYIYWQRSNDGSGMYPRDVMDILLKSGCCFEHLIPYDRNIKEKGPITEEERVAASNYKIKTYARIYTLDELTQALIEFGPVFVAIPIFESFFRTSASGIVPMPNAENEKIVGGHALIFCGIDYPNQLIKFKNSWGKDWGKAGYGFLSFDYFKKYAWDLWQVVDAESTKLTFKQKLLNLWIKFLFWYKTQYLLFWFIISCIATFIVWIIRNI